MFQLLQFLELSKSFSSYLCILHSNKTVSSNIWLWSFFDSWKTFYTPNKAAGWKLLLPIYPSFWFLDWLHHFLSMTILVAWCSSIKKSGPSNHEFPFLSRWRRLVWSITSLVHILAGFILLSMCCQLPESVYSSISAARFGTYSLNLWDLYVIYCSVNAESVQYLKVLNGKLITFLMAWAIRTPTTATFSSNLGSDTSLDR